MNKKELIFHTLEKMGYKPDIDEDGDIQIRYQMKSIFVFVGDEEDSYVAVLLPQFHEIAEGEEPLVLATCNKMTRELKLAKVFVDQTFKSVSASCEFFYANEESLELNIRRSLELLGVVRGIFRRDMDELSEDE
jgi:hypothetical protein